MIDWRTIHIFLKHVRIPYSKTTKYNEENFKNSIKFIF